MIDLFASLYSPLILKLFQSLRYHDNWDNVYKRVIFTQKHLLYEENPVGVNLLSHSFVFY